MFLVENMNSCHSCQKVKSFVHYRGLVSVGGEGAIATTDFWEVLILHPQIAEKISIQNSLSTKNFGLHLKICTHSFKILNRSLHYEHLSWQAKGEGKKVFFSYLPPSSFFNLHIIRRE